jgi:hypothetical protein
MDRELAAMKDSIHKGDCELLPVKWRGKLFWYLEHKTVFSDAAIIFSGTHDYPFSTILTFLPTKARPSPLQRKEKAHSVGPNLPSNPTVAM